MLSHVAKSNLFTKAVAAKRDPRQEVPDMYAVPNAETRLLLARLVYEEAMETVNALGCHHNGRDIRLDADESFAPLEIDIDDIIDGACDTIYVATGVLCAVGAPDLLHLQEVCLANDNKFPGGEAIIHQPTGKYLKPDFWVPPDHKELRESVSRIKINLRDEGQKLLAEVERKGQQ